MKRFRILLLIVLLAACSDPPAEAPVAGSSAKPQLYTVNYPLAWLSEQLLGDLADVHFPAPAEGDPAFWKPGVEQIAQFQGADLIILNGAAYAGWLKHVSLPASRLVETSQQFSDRIIYENSGPVHSHGPDGAHSHGEAAFTVWLDPTLMDLQARAIAQAATQLMPENTDTIDANLAQLTALIDSWDAELDTISAQLKDTPLLYSHPVYQYLQRRYQLNGHSLHWEPDQIPGEDQWQALAALLNSHPAPLMLWEAEPLPQLSARLLEMGIRVVVYRPQGNRPADGNFADVMAANIDALSAASQPSPL